MAVITQEYDIDLKATGWYPVVEMSQFDTGSRTVVLRVYGGENLVPLDGCVARIDGRRSDGVEFSASCTIGANSTVSFVASQEMTRAAGKHVAELVIIDAQGNTAGTQNFILDVEPAPMLRDAAASADDRTLYDQFTASVESKFASLSDELTAKAYKLPPATADSLGGIKVGSNLTVTADGTLSATGAEIAIASGTSGGWEYVKYASGRCMIYSVKEFSATTATDVRKCPSDNYPFALNFGRPTAISVSGGVTGEPQGYVALSRAESTYIDAYVYKSEASKRTIVVYYMLVGWWR